MSAHRRLDIYFAPSSTRPLNLWRRRWYESVQPIGAVGQHFLQFDRAPEHQVWLAVEFAARTSALTHVQPRRQRSSGRAGVCGSNQPATRRLNCLDRIGDCPNPPMPAKRFLLRRLQFESPERSNSGEFDPVSDEV